MQEGWQYYNHAMIPTVAPHVEVVHPVNNRKFWKISGGYPILARWTSNFDCGYETNFWYVIKDTPFDISSLKAKRRYEINKGKKHFSVRRIIASDYADALIEVTKAAYSGWPKKYRPSFDETSFLREINSWNSKVIYGGFDNETGCLCAYSCLTEHSECLEFNALRVDPQFERIGINAAMVATLVEDYNERLGNNFYIIDGARSIRHETAFQDYLEKYFGFRKAYCKLYVMYRFPFGIGIKMLYPFRRLIKSESKIGSTVKSVLIMEELSRV